VIAADDRSVGDYLQNNIFFDEIDLYLSGDNLRKIPN
jgi:hypothetical protein